MVGSQQAESHIKMLSTATNHGFVLNCRYCETDNNTVAEGRNARLQFNLQLVDKRLFSSKANFVGRLTLFRARQFT